MRIWFPDAYTEAHRTPDRQLDLVRAMTAAGMSVSINSHLPRGKIDLVFCGSVYRAEVVRLEAPRNVPVVQYNWDLYPRVVASDKAVGWQAYLKDLKRASRVLVPSGAVTARTHEMTGKHSHVVLAPVKVWEFDELRTPDTKPYAVDVMRDYAWDAGNERAAHACERLGLRLVRTKTRTDWDEFRWLVGNADVLISAVDEASTGGLTLLEGYAHGVPVVVPATTYHGAQEYFGGRARYFDPADGPDGLARTISDTLEKMWSPDHTTKCRKWVERDFSDGRFATDLAREFAKCLGSC